MRKRKHKHKHNKCIYFAYCKNDAGRSQEHAYPDKLMPPNSAGVTINGIICQKCNNRLGKLDEQVIRQSSIGWLHNEFETFEDRGSSSFYHKAHHHYPPLRFLGVFKSNGFALLEPKDFITDEDVLVMKAAASMPSQIIVNRMDSYEDILNENPVFHPLEKDGHKEKDVYCVDQNRLMVFGPIALKGYYDKSGCYHKGYYHNPDEFIRKFLNNTKSETLRMSYTPPNPENPVLREAEIFIKFLEKTGRSELIPFDKSDLRPEEVILLSPDTSRGVAKIAFHCFLHKNQKRFTGHEEMFDEIKAFIYNGDYSDKLLVAERPPYDDYPALGEQAAIAHSSNPKCNVEHLFRFFKNGANILCISEFYVGTRMSLLFTVILSGCDEDLLMEPFVDFSIPYEVSRKNPLLKRILPAVPGNPLSQIRYPTDNDILRAGVGDLTRSSLNNRIRLLGK